MSAGFGGCISGTIPARPFGASLVVDSVNGSDASAQRFGAPAKTLGKAQSLAVAGDTILVLPGTYNEHNLAKHLVNWHFLPGATVTWTDDGTAPGGKAIFDDNSTAMTFRVTGKGNFTVVMSGAFVGFGLVVTLQNAASDVSFECGDVSATGGFNQSHSAFSIKSCLKFVLDFNTLTDPNFGSGTSFATGVYWEKGETYIRGKIMKQDIGCIWCNEPAGSPSTNLYADVQHIESNYLSAIYFTALTVGTNYKAWITCNQVTSVTSAAVFTQTGGKLYVTAQKISTTGAAPAITVNGGVSPFTPLVWIVAQKISSGNQWLNTGASFAGKLELTAMEYEDTGAIAAGFNIAGTGTVNFHGGNAKVLNGQGIIATGATLIRVKDMVLNTANTNSAGNNPVKLNVNTVVLDNCTLLAPALANAITIAVSAQTFKNYGTKGTTALNASVTVLGGDAYAADANVI